MEPEADGKIELATKLELLNLISGSRRQQELYIDTIANSVILAANQVQDKRIDLLEEGPELTIEQVFLDVVLGLIFGPIAGGLVQRATNKLFSRILGPRTLHKVLFSRQVVSASAIRAARSFQFRMERTVVNFFVQRQSEEYKLLREIADGTVGVILDTTKKLVYRKRLSTDSLAGDSASVSMMGEVLSFAGHQKATVNRFHDQLAILVQNDGLDTDAAESLGDLLRSGISDPTEGFGLSYLSDQLKRVYELGIWIALFKKRLGAGKLIREKSETELRPDPYDLKAQYLVQTGRTYKVFSRSVPSRLIDYWLRRFKDPNPENKLNFSFLDFQKKMRNLPDRKAESEARTALINHIEHIEKSNSVEGFELGRLGKFKDGVTKV